MLAAFYQPKIDLYIKKAPALRKCSPLRRKIARCAEKSVAAEKNRPL
jgi:hypothetical protein